MVEQQFPLVFAVRDPEGHKGTFGSVGILGGAPGMTGAVILAGRAALKSGVGKTYLALAQTPLPVAYDSNYPELMLHEASGLIESASSMTAWVAGCGLGQAPAALALLGASLLFALNFLSCWTLMHSMRSHRERFQTHGAKGWWC